MIPLTKRAALLVSAALLAGCTAPTQYDGSEKVARNEVRLVRLAHPVPPVDTLSKTDRQEITRFLLDVGLGYGDTVSILADEGFAATPDVADLLRDFGMPLMAPPAAVAEAPPAGGALLLVDRFVVTPPECPNTTLQLSRNYANAPSPHFGCANMLNLGQMVANPRDLATGIGDPRPITDKATQGIRLWREDIPEFVEPQNAEEGADAFTVEGG